MAARTITPQESELAQRLLANARVGDGGHCRLRPGESRSHLPGGRLGGRQPRLRRTPRQHERRRERHGQPRAAAPRQGARHPPRCASPEEHGHHRRDSREGHRQVRETGRRDLLADSGHEPVHHADRHRDLRHQVQGRGDLLAASIEQEDDERNRATDARGARRSSAFRKMSCSASSSRAFRWPTS